GDGLGLGAERGRGVGGRREGGQRQRDWGDAADFCCAGAHGGHARLRGGQGVSATGVSGPLPAAQAARLSTTSWSILVRVHSDAEPRWGNSTTLSISISSFGTSGSFTKTSRPAE